MASSNRPTKYQKAPKRAASGLSYRQENYGPGLFTDARAKKSLAVSRKSLAAFLKGYQKQYPECDWQAGAKPFASSLLEIARHYWHDRDLDETIDTRDEVKILTSGAASLLETIKGMSDRAKRDVGIQAMKSRHTDQTESGVTSASGGIIGETTAALNRLVSVGLAIGALPHPSIAKKSVRNACSNACSLWEEVTGLSFKGSLRPLDTVTLKKPEFKAHGPLFVQKIVMSTDPKITFQEVRAGLQYVRTRESARALIGTWYTHEFRLQGGQCRTTPQSSALFLGAKDKGRIDCGVNFAELDLRYSRGKINFSLQGFISAKPVTGTGAATLTADGSLLVSCRCSVESWSASRIIEATFKAARGDKTGQF